MPFNFSAWYRLQRGRLLSYALHSGKLSRNCKAPDAARRRRAAQHQMATLRRAYAEVRTAS
jgi:hypothetical protein